MTDVIFETSVQIGPEKSKNNIKIYKDKSTNSLSRIQSIQKQNIDLLGKRPDILSFEAKFLRGSIQADKQATRGYTAFQFPSWHQILYG